MKRYRRKLGLFRNAEATREIASLDALRDCQRIVHLLVVYEFPWDLQRALELALFHTYGSDSVARLLDRTGEFRARGQRRYDDTQILIGRFMESGWDGEFGARAIRRMNEIHARFEIPNDDYLFVLSTFISFPIRWMAHFAWRSFTRHEELAWFAFWRDVGQRMGIENIPDNRADLDAFVERYEREHLLYNEPSRRVADATVDVLRAWLPAPLRGVVRPTVTALIDERLRIAFGYPRAPRALGPLARSALRVRGWVTEWIPLSHYPSLLDDLHTRSYAADLPSVENTGVGPGSARSN